MDIMNDTSCTCYANETGVINKIRAVLVTKPLVFVVVALIIGIGLGSMSQAIKNYLTLKNTPPLNYIKGYIKSIIIIIFILILSFMVTSGCSVCVYNCI